MWWILHSISWAPSLHLHRQPRYRRQDPPEEDAPLCLRSDMLKKVPKPNKRVTRLNKGLICVPIELARVSRPVYLPESRQEGLSVQDLWEILEGGFDVAPGGLVTGEGHCVFPSLQAPWFLTSRHAKKEKETLFSGLTIKDIVWTIKEEKKSEHQ